MIVIWDLSSASELLTIHLDCLQDANRGAPAAPAPSQTLKDKDPDEEMVQDKEDTVIY